MDVPSGQGIAFIRGDNSRFVNNLFFGPGESEDGINRDNGSSTLELINNRFEGFNDPVHGGGVETGDVIRDNSGFVTENEGADTQSGDGVTETFTIPHGLVVEPTVSNVWPESEDASGEFWISDKDGTNIEISYSEPPADGTDNLMWGFEARFIA